MANSDNTEPLHKYAEACVVMKHAIENKDKEKLISAMEAMDELEIDRGQQISFSRTSDKGKRPEIIFLPEYADYLLLNDFEIASLDDASMLRSSSSFADVLALTNRCEAQSEMQYELEGEGDMELFLLSASENKPEIKIVSGEGNTPVALKTEVDKGVMWWRWNMDEAGKFRIILTNNSDSDVDFVIGLN